MYWDGEKRTYIPAATEQSNAEGASFSTAPSDSLFGTPGSKEKKEKPKSKTAQQVFYILHTSTNQWTGTFINLTITFRYYTPHSIYVAHFDFWGFISTDS